jgi:ferredoxin-NADP reductase
MVHLTFAGQLALTGGEYVYVKLPRVNANEWRPFTVLGRDNGFELHIRAQPDVPGRRSTSWTARLKQAALGGMVVPGTLALIDGPHASPASKFRAFDRVFLVATGIGATAVASVLRNLYGSGRMPARVWCITVVVVLRFEELEWFAWLLDDLAAAANADVPFAFKAHIHVSGGAGAEAKLERLAAVRGGLASAAQDEAEGRCALQVHVSRPSWRDIVAQEAQRQEGARPGAGRAQHVGLFCTGPPSLYREVKRAVAAKPGYQVFREVF